jgi:signal transduction histidine kinase
MNSSTISSPITKPRSYIPSSNLFKSLTPPKIVQKKPGLLASALAHEVRNPLSNINLAVEMLKSMNGGDDQKIYLDIIMRSSVRINDLIKELLKYQEADEVQAEKHSIHQLLDEVLVMIEDRIMLKNIAIRKDYAAQDCKIILNGPKMKIALTNIIINAIDAMTSGKGELKLVTRSIDGNYVIQIEDNGCGIGKGDLKNIFKPYFTNKPGGLGLGLATTYHILRSNHVGVNVESNEGGGTRFMLMFEKNINIILSK